jgi:gamma-glutamyltranspeptidase
MAAAENQARTAGRSRAAAIDAVRDHFYRGDIARRIDAFSRANDGSALRGHGGVPRRNRSAGFHHHRGATVRRASVAGLSMLQALNILRLTPQWG